MDKVDLSNSPDLTIEEITKQLFNNELMSDVQFHVEGKVLYAHTWELKKRSIVFRNQLQNLEVYEPIKVHDVSYDVVYEFLRFIYTDECDIREEIKCDMLKLAMKYEIVELQTMKQDNKLDEVDLCNSPVLTMAEITKQLFNNELMSDVQFHVDGKVLYAHTWELMKRSIVFREQFRGTLGVNKMIPVEDTPYDVVYQFLRYIYTDEIVILNTKLCDMLKLAVRYKIVKLETKVMSNQATHRITDLELFGFCLVNKFELLYHETFNSVIGGLSYLVEEDDFLKIKSNVMEKILKSDHLHSEMTEVNLFNALVQWMKISCEINQLPITQRRSHFDKLFRLIRFPTMTNDEFHFCLKNHPDLFTSDDVATIYQQIILKGQCEKPKWIGEPRLAYVDPWIVVQTPVNHKWKTKFTVADNLILRGLKFGIGFCGFIIKISGTNRTTNATDVQIFNFVDLLCDFSNMVSLGESIKLKPNIDYTIEVIYNYTTDQVDEGNEKVEVDKEDGEVVAIVCRKPNVNCIVTGSYDLVTFTEISDNLFEIIVKSPII